MGKVSTTAKWTAGVGGAAVTLGMQISPDVAASNLSTWLKLVGVERVPAFLLRPEADGIGTIVGVALMLAALI